MLVEFSQRAMIIDDGRMLLLQKSNGDVNYPMQWELPGGRLEDIEEQDEFLLDENLKREIREEVGLEVEPAEPLAVWSWRLEKGPRTARIVAICRRCELIGDNQLVTIAGQDDGDNIETWKWVPLPHVDAQPLIPNTREPIRRSVDMLRVLGYIE